MYRAIARYLRGELSRVGAAGAVLPSEAEMARRYGVSRMTLRQALDELAEEGLIQRRQGRATVISERRYVREYAGLRSFFEEVVGSGGVPSSRVLDIRVGALPEALRDVAGFRVKEAAYYCIRRLRLADGIAMGIHTAYVDQRLCPELDRHDLEHESLLHLYEVNYGLRVAKAVQQISARIASEEEAELLGIPQGAAVLVHIGRTLLETGKLLEYLEAVYRTDRYGYTITLHRG